MTPVRRICALSALALTLVLGACSTPDDLAAPTLEPQFGTADNDFGVDVAYPASGRAYVLSEREGYIYDEYGYSEGSLDDVILSRYDSSGQLIWSRTVASAGCSYDDDYCDDMGVKAHALAADSRGYSYALVTYGYTSGDCSVQNSHYVEKYDASGSFVQDVYVGTSGGELGAGFNATPTDLAVDGNANLYVVRQQGMFVDGCYEGSTNVIAKYSATGTLQWQRVSTVGTLYSISLSSSGFVYVGGSKGVAKYSSSGDLRWTKTGAADEIAVSGTSSIYARYRTTVRKLNADGKQLWGKTQSGLSGMVVGGMTTDANANLYLTGKYSASGRSRDVFTRKLNSSGSTLFTKTFGTTAYDDANGIATLNGSEIYLTGATQGALVPPYRGGNDGYIRKLNSSGNPVWTR